MTQNTQTRGGRMKLFRDLLLLGCAATVGIGFWADAQEARESPVTVRKISGSKVRTPEYRVVSGQAQPRSREWFSIVAQYDTTPDWIDELTFTYYVLIKGKTSEQPKYTLLTGEVTYVNIQKGKHLSDMYLHPSTLARYGDVAGVAVLVKLQGRLVAVAAEPSTPARWWEQFSPVSGLVLNRMQTPFAMINFDDYEAIKF